MSAPELRLLRPPVDEPATRLRRELKFELPAADFRKVDRILRLNQRSVAFAGRESLVHSVYFDDPRLGSCAESNAGVGRRSKLRLRWYDTPLPGELAFFEVKRRVGELLDKRRFPLTATAGLAGVSYRRLVRGLLDLLPEEARELLAARRMPVVLVRYRRRHYRDRQPGSPVRLTLDRQITVFDQVGAAAPRSRFGARLGDRVVLELKCPPAWPAAAPRRLHPLRPRRTRCSKYVLACRQLGAWTGVAPAAWD